MAHAWENASEEMIMELFIAHLAPRHFHSWSDLAVRPSTAFAALRTLKLWNKAVQHENYVNHKHLHILQRYIRWSIRGHSPPVASWQSMRVHQIRGGWTQHDTRGVWYPNKRIVRQCRVPPATWSCCVTSHRFPPWKSQVVARFLP